MKRAILFLISVLVTIPSALAADIAAGRPDASEWAQVKSGWFAKGDLLKAIRYRDADGSVRIFAVGEEYGPSDLGLGYLAHLHAYNFIERDGQLQLKWQINESAGALSGIIPHLKDVTVVDPGQDGTALVMLPYTYAVDGLDPNTVKLIAYYGNKKYAIRGYQPKEEGDKPSVEPEPDVATLPQPVQKAMWQVWNKVFKSEYPDIAAGPPDASELEQVRSGWFAQGELLKAIQYHDRDGSVRIFAVGGTYGGTGLGQKVLNNLQAYNFVERNGQLQLKWQIKESAGSLSYITPHVEDVTVLDPDKDGIALVLLPYTVRYDGLDPDTAKLIAYYGDSKYAIRGSLPKEGDKPSVVPEPGVATLFDSVQEAMWQVWKKVFKTAP